MGNQCSQNASKQSSSITQTPPLIDPKPDTIPEPAALDLVNTLPQNVQFKLTIKYSNITVTDRFVSGLKLFIQTAIKWYDKQTANDQEEENDSKQSISNKIFINLATENDKASYLGNEKSTVTGQIFGVITLGLVTQYILLNRPFLMQITLEPMWNCKTSNIITFGIEPVFTNKRNIDYLTKCRQLNESIAMITDWNEFEKYIKMIHVHAHFDKKIHRVALGVYQSLLNFLKNKLNKYNQFENLIKDKRVVYHKNGPHNCWNWQIYTKDSFSFGCMLIWLIENRQKNMYHPFHIRTYDHIPDNEYHDHVLRLGWIGPSDNIHPLDVDFFTVV